MTLPVVPGSSLSFSQINTELGYSSTAQISLNDSAVRTLAGVGASPAQIAITNLSGKSNTFSFTISSNQTNANLASLATAAGWNGTSNLVATIGSGVYISSNSTGTPALTVNGTFPNGVSLTNNGVIVGMGGAGGYGGGWYGGVAGPAAGSGGGGALSVSSAITITNNNVIAGGGGGGGGGGCHYGTDCFGTEVWGGGGGGGGQSSAAANSSGGGGGPRSPYSGGTGATGGSGTSGGAGGGGAGAYFNGNFNGGAGGSGGGWGAGGGTGVNGSTFQGTYQNGAGGGSGGYAVSGNANITWSATGTRYGSIG